MPGNEEHAQHSYKRYRIRAEDLHRWMDEPHKLYGNAHIWVRHQPDDVKNPPTWAVEKYGLERTKDIMMDHILLDRETSEASRQDTIEGTIEQIAMGKRRVYYRPSKDFNVTIRDRRTRRDPPKPKPPQCPWADDIARKWFKWWLMYTFIGLVLVSYWTTSILGWLFISGWFTLSAITFWYAVTEKIKCPKCGHKMGRKYPYCTECGEKLQEADTDRKQPPPSKKDKVVYPPPKWLDDEDDELIEDFLIVELTEEEEDEE